MKLKNIVEQLGGTINGDPELEVTDALGLEFAQARHITFLTDKKHLAKLEASNASAALVPEGIESSKAVIVHPQPAVAFAKLVALFHPESKPAPGISDQAIVGSNVTLGKDVTLCPRVVVGDNVSIGDNTVLHPGVVVGSNCSIGKECIFHPNTTLYKDTVVGDYVILHAGVVIGTDGFGYVPDEKGVHVKVPQTGRVVIGDHVEIGANTCVDRATFGETVIHEGTKIDNLVQVAHNCTVGAHSILVSQVGLAGSCTLGHHVVLAGQVGLADHVTIGDQVTLAARSATFRDIPDAGVYGGAPAQPVKPWQKLLAVTAKLPEMATRLKDLEKRVGTIEKG